MSVDEKYFRIPKNMIYSDDVAVIIKHPKPVSNYHLVTSITNKVKSTELCNVDKQSVQMINHMKFVTNATIKWLVPKAIKLEMGFIGTDVSGCNLQLHTVSTDFSGPFMDEENWNLFTTNLFIPIEDVLESIKIDGHFSGPTDSQVEVLLNEDMRCVHCDTHFGTFNTLKDHLKTHFKELPKIK